MGTSAEQSLACLVARRTRRCRWSARTRPACAPALPGSAAGRSSRARGARTTPLQRSSPRRQLRWEMTRSSPAPGSSVRAVCALARAAAYHRLPLPPSRPVRCSREAGGRRKPQHRSTERAGAAGELLTAGRASSSEGKGPSPWRQAASSASRKSRGIVRPPRGLCGSHPSPSDHHALLEGCRLPAERQLAAWQRGASDGAASPAGSRPGG